MIKAFVLVLVIAAAEYFVCDSNGHACKVGTSCCSREGGGFGCCPFANGVCCSDSSAHCCPIGYPICDIVHHKCTNHLQLTQSLGSKAESLNIKDASEFLYGLATGLGVRLDQYVTCVQQTSITVTLLLQTTKYLQGSTTLDNLIMIQELGDALQHLSLASFNCAGALETSTNFLKEFLKEVDNSNEIMWAVIGNFLSYGNYIERDYAKIATADWEGKGYYVGKIITYLFRNS